MMNRGIDIRFVNIVKSEGLDKKRLDELLYWEKYKEGTSMITKKDVTKNLKERIQELRKVRQEDRFQKIIVLHHPKMRIKEEFNYNHRDRAMKNFLLTIRLKRSNLKELDKDPRAFYDVVGHVISYPINFRHKEFKNLVDAFKYWKSFMKSRECFKVKQPPSEQAIGVEIELISDLDRFQLAEKLMDFSNKIHIKSDGSIRETEDYPNAHEITIVDTQDKIYDTITKVCIILQENCIVNKSCGLHVHLDMRDAGYSGAANAFRKLKVWQGLMLKLQPPSRKKSIYCRPNRHRTLQAALDSGGRYYAVNADAYNRFKTIEIRCHSSTIEYAKINNWIKFLVAIVNSDMMNYQSGKRFSATTSKLNSFLKLPEETVLHFKERFKKYSGMTQEQENQEDATNSGEAICSDCGYAESICRCNICPECEHDYDDCTCHICDDCGEHVDCCSCHSDRN